MTFDPDSPPPDGGWATRPRSDEFEAALASGDRSRQLIAIRDLLVYKLQCAGPRDTAAISRELRDVLDMIEANPTGDEQNALEFGRNSVRARFEEIVRNAKPPSSSPSD